MITTRRRGRNDEQTKSVPKIYPTKMHNGMMSKKQKQKIKHQTNHSKPLVRFEQLSKAIKWSKKLENWVPDKSFTCTIAQPLHSLCMCCWWVILFFSLHVQSTLPSIYGRPCQPELHQWQSAEREESDLSVVCVAHCVWPIDAGCLFRTISYRSHSHFRIVFQAIYPFWQNAIRFVCM